MKIVHILNGDALFERFPSEIEGEVIVFRECLIEGPLSDRSLPDFFKSRNEYLESRYPSEIDYFEDVAAQIEQITTFDKNTHIYLWFEDDLFCQTNMWFIATLLKHREPSHTFLVRPPNNLHLGFGGLSESDLISAFEHAIEINTSSLNLFTELWYGYSEKNIDTLRALSSSVPKQLDFIKPAIEAELSRLELDEPKQVIKNIILSLEEASFPLVFRKFHQEYPIYGYGDLQVKKLYDELLTEI